MQKKGGTAEKLWLCMSVELYPPINIVELKGIYYCSIIVIELANNKLLFSKINKNNVKCINLPKFSYVWALVDVSTALRRADHEVIAALVWTLSKHGSQTSSQSNAVSPVDASIHPRDHRGDNLALHFFCLWKLTQRIKYWSHI